MPREFHFHVQSAVFGALLARTGNPVTAAREVGMGAKWARRMLDAHPELAAAVARGTDQEKKPGDWKDLHPKAMEAVGRALENGDPREQLHAAELVIERVEGRVPQRVETDGLDASGVLGIILYRYAANCMLAGVMSFEDAIRQGEADPSIPEAWGREVGLLKPGETEIAPASGP